MDEAAYSAAVAAIYDAALDPSLWPHALEQISDLFASGPAALLFQDQVTMQGTGVTVRLDPTALETHYTQYGRRNPLTARNDLAALRGGRLPINTDEDILRKAEFMATEYYNEFFAPNGMHHVLMLAAGKHESSIATVNFIRSADAAQFDSPEIELGRMLQPHFARAFRISLQLAESGTQGAMLADLLDRSAHGMFLVAADGTLRRANSAGLGMIGDGLMLTQGELTASSPDAARRLRRLIGEAAERNGEPRGGTMVLPRPSLRRAYLVVVTPLGRSSAQVFDVGPTALVSVADPDQTATPNGRLLAQLFGLTPAEVRTAERLVLGDTPRQAADALGIGLSTLRWHLAAIFRKTGTTRQAELVRLLLALPSG